jgi:uncharacterized protein
MHRVVLDTNIILSAISTFSPYRTIIDKLLDAKFILVVSSEVLLEYEEKISEVFSHSTAGNFIDAILMLPNVERVTPLFTSGLLKDSDDTKFLDLYYSSRANYLVTNDRDFNILNKITNPKHNVIKMEEFIKLINE